jgi:recombination associated protein RdgC
MFFKNLTIYNFTKSFSMNPEDLVQALAVNEFKKCPASSLSSMGWVAPLKEELIHVANGCFMLKLRKEERILPASVINEELAEKVDAIETAQLRKVRRTERLQLKDEIIFSLLPKAFTHSKLGQTHQILA